MTPLPESTLRRPGYAAKCPMYDVGCPPYPSRIPSEALRIFVCFVGVAFSHYRQKLSAAKVTFTHERLLHLAFDSGMIRWIAELGQTREVFKLAFALESLLFGEHS